MSTPLIDPSDYDHPEHFVDRIREYRTYGRYKPTPLMNLLYEISGHKCTICKAPWLEIHHIDELNEGGSTSYDNLIVLCPNCHTRVHSEGVPSKSELRHYKLKQEIAYELPILGRLSQKEWDLVRRVSELTAEDQLLFSEFFHELIPADEKASNHQDDALKIARKNNGYLYLYETGIVSVDCDSIATVEGDGQVSVSLRTKFSSKGIKWLRYLKDAGHISAFESKSGDQSP
jgi:hypothetical protein